jgi:ribosomal protein L11 methyltransferase
MSEPRYPYVHVDVPGDEAELVSAELFELGALGLEERDATTLVRARDTVAVTLVASFADEAGAAAAQAELAPRYVARIEYVVGDAWRDGWREFFKPLRVGRRLVIVPAWEKFDAGAEDVIVVLEPGQAFGTGTHESTQLVLAQLESHVRVGSALLDVGTGSGILAIAALALGASEALALDTDPLAVSAARENAVQNGVGERLVASDAGVESVGERYPLVLANIEARVLVPLAPAIAARVAAGGTLILSGLLLGDAEPVRAAYPELTELARPILGEWCALVLQRSAAG